MSIPATLNRLRSIAPEVAPESSPRSSVNFSTHPFSEEQYLWLQSVNEHSKANSTESREHLIALCDATEDSSLASPYLNDVIKAIQAAKPTFMGLSQLRAAAKTAMSLTDRAISPLITSSTPTHFFNTLTRSTSEN